MTNDEKLKKARSMKGSEQVQQEKERILKALRQKSPQTVKELAEACKIPRRFMPTRLACLENKNLVTQQRFGGTRRSLWHLGVVYYHDPDLKRPAEPPPPPPSRVDRQRIIEACRHQPMTLVGLYTHLGLSSTEEGDELRTALGELHIEEKLTVTFGNGFKEYVVPGDGIPRRGKPKPPMFELVEEPKIDNPFDAAIRAAKEWALEADLDVDQFALVKEMIAVTRKVRELAG
jgi:hypothetical protein